LAVPDHDHHSEQHDHSELSDIQLRVRALETILTEKGYVDPAAIDLLVESYETKIGPKNGAHIVARAWIDPDFKAALLKDATEAANSLGHVSPVGSHLIAVENTAKPTTSSFAHYARVIRGKCWACRRSGTNRRPIAHAR
jgi:nitrile hydratase